MCTFIQQQCQMKLLIVSIASLFLSESERKIKEMKSPHSNIEKLLTYFYLPDPERTPQNLSLLRSTCLDNALAPWLNLHPFISTKKNNILNYMSQSLTTMYQ